MKNTQKGSVTLVFILVIVILLVIVGYLYLKSAQPNLQPVTKESANQQTEPECVPEGGSYGAPLTSKDLCCPGLVEQPTSQSGTMGICVKPENRNF